MEGMYTSQPYRCRVQTGIRRFQYVSCQFDALRPLKTTKAIQDALNELPEGLDATRLVGGYHSSVDLESWAPERVFKNLVLQIPIWVVATKSTSMLPAELA